MVGTRTPSYQYVCECVLKCCFSLSDADKEEAQKVETAFNCIKVCCLFLFDPPQMFSALSVPHFNCH